MIIIIIFVLFWEFFTQALADGFSLEFEWQQVSRTLPCILANLNNAVVWMVSTSPVISKSSSPCTNLLVTVPRAQITIGIIVTFIAFSVPKQGPGTYSSFHILSILLCGPPGQQSTQFCKFYFFVDVDYYKIWSSGRDLVIRLYLKIPEELFRLIL